MRTESVDTSNLPPASVTAATAMTQAAKDAQESGKDDFMKIFLAQLKNQDPMEPLDNKEMVAQLAQLNSLEQAIETNRQLSSLQSLTASQGGTQLTNLIGKEMQADGSTINWEADSGRPSEFGFTLHSPADEVLLTISDAKGPLRTVRAESPLVGQPQRIAWDGLGQSGQTAPSGEYSVTLVAKRGKQGDALDTQLVGTAQSVSFDAMGGSVKLGGARVRPQNITQVTQP